MLAFMSYARTDLEVVERLRDGLTASVVRLAFSPDGTLLATPSLDKTVRLWR